MRLAGGAVAPILGGGWDEVAAAGVVGLLVGVVAEFGRRASRAAPMVAPLAAVVASFSATGIAQLGLKASPDTVALAALVTFLPGMSLTIGVRELATEHLQSGVANTANAIIQLLGLVFGVAVGRSLATQWFGIVKHPLTSSGLHRHVPARGGRGRPRVHRDLARSLQGGAGRCAQRPCSPSRPVRSGGRCSGPAAGTFVAALSIGTVGALLAAPLRRPPLVFIVPGVLMLVPGSTGFNSLLQLLTGETVSGIDAGFNAFVTAMAISYGLMVSTVILPPRLIR